MHTVSEGPFGSAVYDSIGKTYAATRAPDRRIEALIHQALGEPLSVLNVGAGTGSYEPRTGFVVALEPSATMVAQRSADAALAVLGVSECLPFRDNSFTSVMAVLTLHHWRDQSAGLTELMRVAQSRVVMLTYDAALADKFWLVRDYLPTNKLIDMRNFPDPAEIASKLNDAKIHQVPIPADCSDGFLCAYWKRPEAYLSPTVQAGISSFAVLPPSEVISGLAALKADLESGRWRDRNQDLLDKDSMDFGYRLIVADV